MRFISKYGRFGVCIRRGHYEAYASGAVREIEPEISVYFQPWKLTPIEREIAIAHWSWNGSLQEQDEVTLVAPDYRIGLYDSLEHQEDAGFSDETRELIEEKLCEHADRFDDVLVVRSQVPPPWPRYDDYRGTPGALIRRLVEDGHDLDAVLTYEREHQNRPKVVEELEQAIASPPSVPEEEEILG